MGRRVAGQAKVAKTSGRVAAADGGRLLVRVGSGAPPPPMGQCARLLWHERGKEGELATSSWRELGDVRVESAQGDSLRLAPIATSTPGGLDGQPTASLPHDTPIRLEWVLP